MPPPPFRAGAAALLRACALAALLAPSLGAQPRAPDAAAAAAVRARYAKREARVRMRDGTHLFTAVYTPRDTSRRYPVLLMRTPYGVAPYGPDAYPAQLGPWKALQDDGYVFVYQDVRGRFMSEGYYQFMTPHLAVKRGPRDVDESTDAYDTIDWVLKNVPRAEPRVGTWGNSAPGFFVAAGLMSGHPAHVAAYPSAPMVDWWLGDDRHHNGVFALAQTFNFLAGFDQPRDGPVTAYPPRPDFGTRDGYAFHLAAGPLSRYSREVLGGRVAFWDSIAAHPDYDAFWQRRGIWRHVKNVRPAVLTVGGWYDAEDRQGPLRLHAALRDSSARTAQTFVMGPWAHGAWNRIDGDVFGPLAFGQATARWFRDSVGTPFFACALKRRCGAALPRVAVFETGGNRWRTMAAWPPREARPRTFWLREDGRLGDSAPEREGSDAYVSDPAKPVPYTQALSFGYWRDYPTEDQRFAGRRPDVLVYRSEPLAADLTVAGPIAVTLHAATTGGDADFVVKVIDAFPPGAPAQHAGGPPMDGYEQLVHGNVMRMRWRRGFGRAEPMRPGEPDSVVVPLEDVLHTFKRGHRVVVHVQSTWFPLLDRNPQTFVPNVYRARAEDFRPATMTVFRSAARPSRVTVGVLP